MKIIQCANLKGFCTETYFLEANFWNIDMVQFMETFKICTLYIDVSKMHILNNMKNMKTCYISH